MNTFLRFFYELISIFFGSLFKGVKELVLGIIGMFNIKEYGRVIDSYKGSFSSGEKVLVYVSIGLLVIVLLAIIFLIIFFIKKQIRKRTTNLNKEELLNEINDLNKKIAKLMKEKDEIMAMKVSQLGIKAGEDDNDNLDEPVSEDVQDNPDIRFPKLVSIDERLKDFKPQTYENNMNLKDLMEAFRCFAASRLKLFYDPILLRPFFAGLACGKLIILQGISGTGKTSLAYAWGKFVKVDSCVSPVEPSWRDKSDFLGYFNELTKKFNETKALGEIYTSGFDDYIHTIILDEMNLARVEYYFAELLSILEMPNRKEWLIDLVPNSWDKDPKKLENGKLRLPGNLWYIGTINNDDSTFMVTDKVYDRAMPIDINTKTDPFKCKDQDAMDINSSYLESLFKDAIEKYPLSDKGLEQVKEMDNYVIEHFRIAFGNRIMKQLNTFVPVYVACGGKEVEAIDYFIAKKILRKFDQLSIQFISKEIDPFISYLNKNFGKDVMRECIAYLNNIKKNM